MSADRILKAAIRLRKANSIPRPINRRLVQSRNDFHGCVLKSGEAILGELRQIKERHLNTNEEGIEEGS